MRIIHLSDIHVWRYDFNPFHLINKRAIGMTELITTRARKFRLERLHEVVDRVKSLDADHFLITGDLTTTALSAEFRDAKIALAALLIDPRRVTVLPGNHDRYTTGSVRWRMFEEWFGAFAPTVEYPWLRPLGADTAILGLDATRSHISATGKLPPAQLERAKALLDAPGARPRRLIVANHYPVKAPPAYAEELRKKRMKNAEEVGAWLGGVGPHVYCCGHVHAAWAFRPAEFPGQLCLNSGAPLLRDPTGLRPPGFLEIVLKDRGITANHHAWTGADWSERTVHQDPEFFAPAVESISGGSLPPLV